LLREVGIGAMLHDIGKVRVPAEILNKEAKLTEDEIKIVRKHVHYGQLILEDTPGIADTSVLVAVQHHERIDGSGYPDGLKGKEISQHGQAAAIIDVYDAMTSHRVYKYRVPPTEVLRKLFEWSKYYFDEDLVQNFIRCIGIYPIGSMVYLESGLIGVVLNHGVDSLLHPVIRIIFDAKKQSYIRPYDLDLSKQTGAGDQEKIVSFASQEHWNINAEIYF
jgi:HD-GYP domain-containing protein (c-di-GMP phosphodiesterase class II)